MAEGRHLQGDEVPLTGKRAAELIRRRVERGLLETWLERDEGSLLAQPKNMPVSPGPRVGSCSRRRPCRNCTPDAAIAA